MSIGHAQAGGGGREPRSDLARDDVSADACGESAHVGRQPNAGEGNSRAGHPVAQEAAHRHVGSSDCTFEATARHEATSGSHWSETAGLASMRTWS